MPASVIVGHGIVIDSEGRIKYDPGQPFRVRVEWAIHRVDPPELHGKWWRCRLHGTGGVARAYQYFPRDREDEAREFHRAFTTLRSEHRERSLAVAVRDYIEHLATHGGTHGEPLKTARTKVRSCLEGILQLVDPELRRRNRGQRRPVDLPFRDRPLPEVTPEVAGRMYQERVLSVSAATHHSELIYARAFFAWCVERGWIGANPFAGVKRQGRANKGKEKLGLDQSARFLEVAFSDPHPLGGFAAAACLILECRAEELLTRRVCDLDGNGTVLKIRPYRSEYDTADLKTRDSTRDVRIPEPLRERFRALADAAHRGLLVPGESGWNARLFGTMHGNTLRKHVKRICRAAGVPMVTTHGLRGSGADNAVETGFPLEMVARAMGHSTRNPALPVTTGHYVTPSAIASSRAARKAALLSPEAPSESPGPGSNEPGPSPARPHLKLVP